MAKIKREPTFHQYENAEGIENLVKEIEAFLFTNQALYQDHHARATADQALFVQAKEYRKILKAATEALIRNGGEIRLLSRITTIFENLGLILKEKEFHTTREVTAIDLFRPAIQIAKDVQIQAALATSFTLRVNKWTEEHPVSGQIILISNSVHLLLGGTNKDINRPLGWTTGLTQEEWLNQLSRSHDRGTEAQKRLHGETWRAHEQHGWALEQANAIQIPSSGNISFLSISRHGDRSKQILKFNGPHPFSIAPSNGLEKEITANKEAIRDALLLEASSTQGFGLNDIVRGGRPYER